MTSIQIILCCHKKNRKNKFFVAPLTILKQFEQEKFDNKIENDTIYNYEQKI